MYNHVAFEGYLVDDPVMETVPGKTNRCTVTVSCRRSGHTNAADFVRVNAWGKVADALVAYKQKGDRVLVEGSLRTDMYENWEGEERRIVYINAARIHYMSDDGTGRMAEAFFETYPDLGTIFKKFVKQLKEEEKEKQNELNSQQQAGE